MSESTAIALFGDLDPVGQTLQMDNRVDLQVTGVYRDLPRSSSFHDWQFVSAWDFWLSSNNWMKEGENDWTQEIRTFVELQPSASFEIASEKIERLKLNKLPLEQAARENPILFLQPMSRWHLFPEWKDGKETSTRMQFVWLFGIIGVLVLMLACINFINLSTSRSQLRAKEIGIRKSVGSERIQLVGQFFIETFIVVLVSFGLSLGLASASMPLFNELADKNMHIPWMNPIFILASLCFVLLTSIIAGAYPALFLSSFQPTAVLKGTFILGRSSGYQRKALVVFQFIISVLLVIGTIAVWRQIHFAKARPIGYSREGLVMIRKTSSDFWGKVEALRNKLKDENAIIELAESTNPVTENWFTNNSFNWKGKDPYDHIEFNCSAVSLDFGKTTNWNVIQGRDFSDQYSTDSSAVLLNETALRIIGWENPIDQEIIYDGKRYRVIGILQDVIVESPYETVKPSVYFLQSNHTLNTLGNVWLTLKLNPALSTHEAISRVEKVFKSVLPTVAFDFKFADQEYETKFSGEERVGKLATLFATLAIFISCLGLFGLASFVTQQRTKEIGIRKVMGASALNLWGMLSKDFAYTVGISILISIPIAWYLLNNWLHGFQYRTELSWWIFAGAGSGALIIALLTVSFHAIRAAIANPVKSLRSE